MSFTETHFYHSTSKRLRIIALLVAVCVMASSAAARTVTDPAKAQQIIQALDDSVWIGDGAASDRHVYVLYSTACGWCRKLHAESRDRGDDVQLRWVLHGGAGSGAEYVAEAGTIEAIGRAFEGKAGAVRDREQALRTLDTNAWLTQIIGGQLAYPTLIYAGRNGLQVAVGGGKDLKATLANVVERPGKSAHRSTGHELVNTPPPTLAPAGMTQFINFHEAPLAMHAFPDRQSTRVGEVAHMGLFDAVHGIVGDEWIVVTGLRTGEAGGRTIPAYIHAPEAVALTRLRFEVMPASGHVVAETRTLPIHSHPTRRAPQLDELPPGYQLRRVGEVHIGGEIWDAVVFFDDGGRAYLPR